MNQWMCFDSLCYQYFSIPLSADYLNLFSFLLATGGWCAMGWGWGGIISDVYWVQRYILKAKLQALVYDILPSTTGIFNPTIGSRKQSANKQFFVGAQTVVSLLQTTQIISDVCFITDHAAYASSNITKIAWIKTKLFFLPRVDAPHVCVHAWVLGCFYSRIITRTFRRMLTTSVDSCVKIKSVPSVV